MFNGIDTKNIILDSFKLAKQEKDILTIYDRYELKFCIKTGEEKTIILYTDNGTIPENTPDEYKEKENEFQSKIQEFFLRPLLKTNKSTSRIYLGSFNYKDTSKPVNDINSVNRLTGCTNQQIFNDLIKVLELFENEEITYEEFMKDYSKIVGIQEKQKESKDSEDFKTSLNPNNYGKETKTPKTGKHYALGDIHGYKEPYDTALQILKPEDSLVLLGDVIDRGPNGIAILQDLIRKKVNTPESNITFILGNHEKMMFEALCYILKLNLSPKIINSINSYFSSYSQQKSIYDRYKKTGHSDIKLAEELGKKCVEIEKSIEQIMLEINPNIDIYKMIEVIGNWCQARNGGVKTLQAFMNLKEDEQKNIFEFLKNSYVMKQQKIQGRDILFVHSRPPQDINLVKNLKESNPDGIKATQLPYDELNFILWNRDIDTYSPCKKLGIETVCGHTYEFNTSIVDKQKGFVRLDEGCSHRSSASVGLYCIEDDTVTHIGQDGTILEPNSNGKIKLIDEKGNESTINGSKIPNEVVR